MIFINIHDISAVSYPKSFIFNLKPLPILSIYT